MTTETQTNEVGQEQDYRKEKVYTEICENIRALDANSFKLMGFVPLVSVSAIVVVLLKREAGLSWVTILLSFAGALVTFGLYRWERRNIQICKWFQERAAALERDHFGVKPGEEQFAIRVKEPAPKFENYRFDHLNEFLGFPISQRAAERMIYWTTILAWLLLPLAVYLK